MSDPEVLDLTVDEEDKKKTQKLDLAALAREREARRRSRRSACPLRGRRAPVPEARRRRRRDARADSPGPRRGQEDGPAATDREALPVPGVAPRPQVDAALPLLAPDSRAAPTPRVHRSETGARGQARGARAVAPRPAPRPRRGTVRRRGASGRGGLRRVLVVRRVMLLASSSNCARLLYSIFIAIGRL